MNALERAQEQAIHAHRDLAAAKFAEREWRDRAMDLTKDLDEARSALTDTERERDGLREAVRVYTSHLHLCSHRPCSCGAYTSLVEALPALTASPHHDGRDGRMTTINQDFHAVLHENASLRAERDAARISGMKDLRWAEQAEARVAHLEEALRGICALDTGTTESRAFTIASNALTASPTMTPASEPQRDRHGHVIEDEPSAWRAIQAAAASPSVCPTCGVPSDAGTNCAPTMTVDPEEE